ncbi:hypothetical protein V6N12_036863 [Hibiscus sabdariffa]|uniref:Uncharacterized protein n=1 Tax=Hibiscus sabdariffa TaxID=183260 RepID=A0ABR2BV50_9ROSI
MYDKMGVRENEVDVVVKDGVMMEDDLRDTIGGLDGADVVAKAHPPPSVASSSVTYPISSLSSSMVVEGVMKNNFMKNNLDASLKSCIQPIQKIKDAKQLLLTARRIGLETLVEESLANDDIENEFASIVIQLAFFHHLIVAVNNLIVVKCPKDISDSLRKPDQLKEKDS